MIEGLEILRSSRPRINWIALALLAGACHGAVDAPAPPREDAFREWKCRCEDGSVDGCAHVEGALVVAARCASYVTVSSDARDRGFEVDMAGIGPMPTVDVTVRRSDGLVVTTAVERVSAGTTWRAHVPPFSSHGVDGVRIVVHNTTNEPTQLVAVGIASDLAPPSRAVGSVLFAEHHSELTIAPGRETAEFWAPLPVLHASQVPLYVALETTPPDVQYRFVAHDDTNWGVVFSFPPSKTARDVVLGWRAVVLTRYVWPDQRPQVYGGPAEDWLAPTIVADTRDDVVQDVARSIASVDAPPLVKLERLLAFTTTGLAPPEGVEPRLPSDHNATGSRTLRYRKRDVISCTGFAASTTALGRALGLPTRYITGYVVGESMQTHAIAELYLGPELGWRRVEPQLDELAIAEDYLVVVRVVHPRDEGPETMAEHRFAERGLPLFTLIENLAAPERLVYHNETAYFDGCPRCNNRASRLAVLEDVDQSRLDDAFARATESWIGRRQALVAGGDPAKTFADRADAAARDLEAITRMLE
jgi:hypothetical protein